MRGSMATCAFMMGDNDGGSLAEVTHDTAIDDGNQHTFTFSKGSQASDDAGGLGKNCISLNVDDGTAVSSCNTNCSWVETDTFYIGGLPSDFDRDGQSTDRTPAGSFFGGGGGWDDSWDPSWDDTAIISAGNFITADVRPNLLVCACFAMYWLSRWAWVAQGGSIRDLKSTLLAARRTLPTQPASLRLHLRHRRRRRVGTMMLLVLHRQGPPLRSCCSRRAQCSEYE